VLGVQLTTCCSTVCSNLLPLWRVVVAKLVMLPFSLQREELNWAGLGFLNVS
jgi:hypothetical protein